MPEIIALNGFAYEKGSLFVKMDFKDENGDAITPTAVDWTLVIDGTDTVVNSREAVTVSPSTSITVHLTGNDLKLIDDDDEEWRRIVVQGTYESGTKKLKKMARFKVVKVPKAT